MATSVQHSPRHRLSQYEVATRPSLRIVTPLFSIMRLCPLRDGGSFLSCGSDAMVHRWSSTTGELINTFGRSSSSSSYVETHMGDLGGDTIVIAVDKELKLWNTRTNECLSDLPLPSSVSTLLVLRASTPSTVLLGLKEREGVMELRRNGSNSLELISRVDSDSLLIGGFTEVRDTMVDVSDSTTSMQYDMLTLTIHQFYLSNTI